MDVAREAPLARAAINHRAVIALAGEARGLKPCPGPGEGADRQKILHRVASPAKQLQEISFFSSGINNWLGRKARGALIKSGLTTTSPAALVTPWAGTNRLPNRNSAHFGSVGAVGVVRGCSAMEGMEELCLTQGGINGLLVLFNSSENFHTELWGSAGPGIVQGLLMLVGIVGKEERLLEIGRNCWEEGD